MKNQALFGILFFVFLWRIAGLPLQAQTKSAASSDSVEYVIETMMGGDVQVEEASAGVWDPAQEGQVLESGDEIRVGDNSQATLTMQSGTQVHLYANTDLKVDQIEPNATNGFLSRLIVFTGTILSDVKKNLLESHSSFEVEANGVVCGVRGTAFEVSDINGQVVTATHEGEVEMLRQGQVRLVRAGMALSYRRGQFRGYRRLNQAEKNRFKRWRFMRPRIRAKRLRRLRAIRMGRRRPWVRRHGVHAHIRRAKNNKRPKVQ